MMSDRPLADSFVIYSADREWRLERAHFESSGLRFKLTSFTGLTGTERPLGHLGTGQPSRDELAAALAIQTGPKVADELVGRVEQEHPEYLRQTTA
jgi:hypothetical protein